jgi:hypothetical protein
MWAMQHYRSRRCFKGMAPLNTYDLKMCGSAQIGTVLLAIINGTWVADIQ